MKHLQYDFEYFKKINLDRGINHIVKLDFKILDEAFNLMLH